MPQLWAMPHVWPWARPVADAGAIFSASVPTMGCVSGLAVRDYVLYGCEGTNSGSGPWLMTESDRFNEWKTEWLEAYIWQCGGIFRAIDDECDCRQPVIEHSMPGQRYPWIKRPRLWEGTFISDPEPDQVALQESELEAAAVRYGITLDNDHYGRRPWVAADRDAG